MMDSSPLDTSLPAVREYVALVRLQVLTPLSLLLALASFLVCAFVLRPSLADLVHLYPSVLAPNKRVVGVYLALLFVAQIGLCVLLVVARDPHTKHLLRATAPPLIAANILAALWAPAFALQSFVPAAALQGTLLVALVFALGAGWVSGPGSWPARLFVHAPIRAFFFAPLYIGFPYCLFVALGWTWSPGEPQHFRNHAYAGAAVVLGVNILALVVIVWRHDLVGCVCASWLCAALWSVDPKAAEVWIPAAVFTALRPLALLAAWLWRRIRPRRRQPIALPPDDAEAARAQQHARAPAPEGERPAREVDVDALWG
ncbi:hypothetical protein CERSUDRAFT_114912 [Gelatoporia subvermispora B]|uniref:Uncharacterized protein n=1 Tax=Ceriporiopsis subvermispora (strain B) TaxID=914234 RepID=M2PL42_CERS8|nr:hypothetical protein CERSUDRAFT_114912 [Gelatoporia subvermispora B]